MAQSSKEKWDNHVAKQESLGRKRRPSKFLTDYENEQLNKRLEELRSSNLSKK